MPRGLSWQQQAVLNRLAKHDQPVPVAYLVHHEPALNLHYVANKRIDATARRCIERLFQRGLVQYDYRWFSRELHPGKFGVDVRYCPLKQGEPHAWELLAVSLTKDGRRVVDGAGGDGRDDDE